FGSVNFFGKNARGGKAQIEREFTIARPAFKTSTHLTEQELKEELLEVLGLSVGLNEMSCKSIAYAGGLFEYVNKTITILKWPSQIIEQESKLLDHIPLTWVEDEPFTIKSIRYTTMHCVSTQELKKEVYEKVRLY